MKVEVSEISSVKRTLTIEVPEEDVKKEFSRAYTDLRKRIKVPGFRPGKAPLSLLHNRYADVIREDVVMKLVPDYSRRAVKEVGIKPIVVEYPPVDHMSIKKDEAFSFTATVEVEPTFEVKDVSGIPIKKEIRVVTDEDEEKALDGLRRRQAELHAITEDRDTGEDDFVSVDIKGFIGQKPVADLTQNSVLIHIGSKSSYMGTELDSHLVGKQKGDIVDVTGTFPKDKSYPSFSNKPVELSIKILEVKTAVLPDLDDEFATDLGLESLDELKVKVRESLESQLNKDKEKQYKDQILKHLVETHAFDIPPSLLKEEMALALQHVQHDHSHHESSGKAHSEKSSESDSTEQQEQLRTLQTNIQETATAQVKARFILDAIAKKEGFTLSDDEIETEYGRLADQMKISISEVKKKVHEVGDNKGVDRLKGRLLHQKSLQHVYDNANIHD